MKSGASEPSRTTLEVDCILLKKPQRISASMMIMTICLVVHSFAQCFLRKQLVSSNLSQSGYATNRPSMKWVCRLFHGIHIIKLQIDHAYHDIVVNMNEILIQIVRCLGAVACSIYDIDYKNI